MVPCCGAYVYMRVIPLVQHLYPRNNSKERSRISTYGARIKVYANKKVEQDFLLHCVYSISIIVAFVISKTTFPVTSKYLFLGNDSPW